MAMEFVMDDAAKPSLSPSTQKGLILFSQMLADQENILREYHRDTAPVVFWGD